MESTRLVNTTEIAFLAGVKKATVSMWKARHSDFPKPVTHKLYDADEVEQWMIKNEKGQYAVN